MSRRGQSGQLGGNNIETLYIADIHGGDYGGGVYLPFADEAGFFFYRSLGPLSIGVGGSLALNDAFGFVGLEASVPLPKAPGISAATETIILAGIKASKDSDGPTAYTGRINATGLEIGSHAAGATFLIGNETTQTVHPIDAAVEAFRSIIGPLADPATFIDPFQDGAVINMRP
jgi:hypothetical protein